MRTRAYRFAVMAEGAQAFRAGKTFAYPPCEYDSNKTRSRWWLEGWELARFFTDGDDLGKSRQEAEHLGRELAETKGRLFRVELELRIAEIKLAKRKGRKCKSGS